MMGVILAKVLGVKRRGKLPFWGFQGSRILVNDFKGLNLALSASFLEGFKQG